jgi:FkbM family methyltransferase
VTAPPLRADETRRWADRTVGPPEARIRPRGRALRAGFRLADALPKPYSAYVRAIGVRALSTDPVQLETSWGRLVSPRRDHMFFRPVIDEPLETAVVGRLLEPGMRVVDVGANRGWYTLYAAALVGPTGSVISVEPDPVPLAMLRQNVTANRLANVTIIDGAVGAEAGEFRFVTERESALSHLARDESDTGANQFRVQVQTLDDLVSTAGGGPVDLVKVDVEGAEIDVLAGATQVLHDDRPVVIVEVEEAHQQRYGSTPDDVPRTLGDGYRCFRLCWTHGIAEPFPHGSCASGRNLLCIPAERVEDVLARVFAT